MPSIFISYRRSDSQADAGRIYDRLAAHFGPKAVFKDVDDIPPGADFRDYLNTTLNQCLVVLVVIGPGWLTATDSAGQRRLDNPADWVRVEVEEALRRDGVLVVPLLVGHAAMPRPDELPNSLQNLAYRNCGEARPDPDFHRDMSRLIARLKQYLPLAQSQTTETRPLSWSAKPQWWKPDSQSPVLSRQRFLQWLGWGGLGLVGVWGTRRVVSQLLALEPGSSPLNLDNPDADNNRNPDADNTWGRTDAVTSGSAPDLQHLADLLQARQWAAADEETLALFRAVLAVDPDGWMEAEGFADLYKPRICSTFRRVHLQFTPILPQSTKGLLHTSPQRTVGEMTQRAAYDLDLLSCHQQWGLKDMAVIPNRAAQIAIAIRAAKKTW